MERALTSVCDVLKMQNVAEHILEELVEETSVLQLNTMSAEVIESDKLWCIETIFDASVDTPLRVAAAAVTLKVIQTDAELSSTLEAKIVASLEPAFMSVYGNGKVLEAIVCGFAMVVPESARVDSLMQSLFGVCVAIASTAVSTSAAVDFGVAIGVVAAIISRIFRSAASCPVLRTYLDSRGSQWLLKYCDLLLQCPRSSLIHGRDVVCKAVISSLVESLVVGVANTGDALTLVSLLSFACDRLLAEADGKAGGDLATASMLLAIAMKAIQELEARGDANVDGKASSGAGGKGKGKGRGRGKDEKKKAPPVPAVGCGIAGSASPAAVGGLVEVDIEALYAQIVSKDGFFDCLCDMLLSESVIVRKRAIYLLEHAVVHVVSIPNPVSASSAGYDGYLGRRYWLQDFIDIYHQVDGCSSAHLIDQVWTHARHIFKYMYEVEAAEAAGRTPRRGHPALPPVAFKWTKIIVNAVLASKSATVRKTMVYRLLACHDSAETLLLFPTTEVIHWFCFDMLKRLDQAAVFFGGIGHRSSQISLADSAFVLTAQTVGDDSGGSDGYKVVLTDADYRLHPGLLLPHFVREFNMQILRHPDVTTRASLSRLLHLSLMQMTCLTDDAVVRSASVQTDRPAVGLGSLLAIKWLMRAFPLAAQPTPREPICSDSCDLLRSAAGTGLYSCCCEDAQCSCHYFGLEELTLVNQMLSSKFLSANLAIASQVLDGLLPWLFSRVHVDNQAAAAIHAGGSQQRYACLVLKSMLNILSTGGASSKSADSSQMSPLTRMLAINLDQVRSAIGRVMALITDDAELVVCFGQVDMRLLGLVHVLSPVDVPFLATKLETALSSFMDAATLAPGDVLFLDGVGTAIQSVVAVTAEGGSSVARQRALLIGRAFRDPLSGGVVALSCHLATHIGDLFSPHSDTSAIVGSSISSLDVLDACCSVLGHCVMLTTLAGEQLPPISGVVTLLAQCSTRLEDTADTGDCVIRKVMTVRILSHLMKGVSAASSGLNVLPPLMPGLVERLVTVPEISIGDFKAAREVLLAIDAGAAVASTLATDLLPLFDRFSRCANHFMVCRWSATYACVRVLGAVELALPGLNTGDGTSPADKLLDFLTGHIDCCIPQVTTILIRSARTMCVSVFMPSDTISFDSKSVGKLESFIASCWHSCVNDGAQENIGAIGAFIEFVFDPVVFAAVGFDALEEYLDKLIALGANWRPYIMQCLVLHLVALWKIGPVHVIPFFRRHMKTLVLYKEPILDDHTLVDSLSVSTADEAVCRCMVLKYIEGLKGDMATAGAFREQLQECLDDFVVDLFTMHMDAQYVPCAMVGTDQFGEKLRSWQTLCIMSTHVTSGLLDRVVSVPVGKETRQFSIKELYFVLMLQNVAHNIRVHVEIFGAALLLQFPEEMLPPFYLALEECNTQQQILASYFIILGHLLVDLDAETGSAHLPLQHYEPMAARLMPWLSCAGGLPRCIAQLAIFEIIPRIVDVSKPAAAGESMHLSYLRGIYTFLVSNKDSVKMVQRQRRFFSDAPIRSRLTLEGLMKYVAADHTGERVPEHLVSVVVATLKSLEYSFSNESKSILLQVQDPEVGTIGAGRAAAAAVAEDCAPCFQTKRTPFEELQIHMADASAARHRNASGRRRQDVIVCASLIDKPVNVAGIARTCEIFAVEMMTLASMDITRTDDFQAVAVSCTEWLPMEEVTEANLLPFIHRCRQKGYTIVGLEQTEASIDLSDPAQTALLPQKCVLILGKEKEGVPVHILDQLDVCLEIPQFGVIRSLNVHVSAAMALWEITKNNMPSLKSTME